MPEARHCPRSQSLSSNNMKKKAMLRELPCKGETTENKQAKKKKICDDFIWLGVAGAGLGRSGWGVLQHDQTSSPRKLPVTLYLIHVY